MNDNLRNKAIIRIGLNLTQVRPEIGGAWYAIKNLLAALSLKADPRFEFHAYCTENSLPLIPDKNKFRIALPSQVANGGSIPARLWREHIWLPSRARKDRIDVIHWFGNYASPMNFIPSLVMVHDLQAFRRPSSLGILQRNYVRFMMHATVRKKCIFAPISRFTGESIQYFLGVPLSHQRVINHVIPERFRPVDDTEEFRKYHNLPERFWLYPANHYPHKNHIMLLQAHSLMNQRGENPWPLIFCGRAAESGPVFEAIKNGRARQLSNLKDDEMTLLYSAAGAVVFPSLYEGCGLPMLEAVACGCRLAVSDIPAAREFVGGSALFFTPGDPASIAKAMLKIQYDGKTTHSQRHTIAAAAKLYNAENICKATLNAYLAAIKSQ